MIWPTEAAGVAISGKAGAGKNAFADVLAEELSGRGFWPAFFAFAEGPKRELYEQMGLTKADPGGREALVNWAHGRREADPDCWVKVLEKTVGSLSPYGIFPILTDLRYPNEYEWSVRSGYVVVRVDATRLDRVTALLRRGEAVDFVDSEHVSEVGLDEANFHVRFFNSHGIFGELRRQAARLADILDGTSEVVAA